MKGNSEEEVSLIHGLELQGRALTSVAAETESVSFLVGTQSLKQDNKIYMISLDEDSGQLVKKGHKHMAGEVWQVDSSPSDPRMFVTTYGGVTEALWRKRAAIWKLPNEDSTVESDEANCPHIELMLELDTLCEGAEVSGVWFQPLDSARLAIVVDDQLILTDMNEGGLSEVWRTNHSVRGQTRIESGRWNPHRNCHQFATVCGSQVIAWDSRTSEQCWSLTQSSGCVVRSLDFNPNKQYFMACGGDDGVTSVWDTRSPDEPVLARRDHSHWVWSVRYNSFHDQLLLSAGSDARVILTSVASLSSEPFGHLVEDEEDGPAPRAVLEDGVIQSFLDHEDSVYTSEWSAADPWTFASLSYDGRLVISHVPRAVKFKILNLV